MKHKQTKGIALALLLVACSDGTSPSAGNQAGAKAKARIMANAELIASATNNFYTVFVNEDPGPGIGQYTVMTGPSHPVTLSTGAPQNVLYGGGETGTSYNTIYSYTTGTYYTANVNFESNGIIVLLDPTHPGISASVTPLGTTGYRTTYVLSGPPNTPDKLTIVQDVGAHGTTYESSSVDVTTKITNDGSTPVSIGLRYLWDTQIGRDDGPTFQALSPDGPVLLTEQTFVSPTFGYFRLQDNDRNTPSPLFSVFGTVTQPSTVTPAPTPPDQLENVAWGVAFYRIFAYATGSFEVSTLASSNDNAVLYYWGATQATAITLTPGAGRTFSESLVSAEANAPPPFNQPPVARISLPSNNASFATGALVSFAGTGTDPEDGALTGASLVWTDNVAGEIGTGTSFSLSTLATGTHVITLTATDSKGATGTASVTITITGAVTNQPPTAHIATPVAGAVFTPGSAIAFSGTGSDPEDGALTGASLVWTDNVAGQIGTGTSFSLATLAGGTHTVTLTATDSKGAHGSATVSFTVAFSQTIGSAGGSLCVEACHLSLYFPAGALSSPTMFFVWTTPAPTPLAGLVGNTAYVISPSLSLAATGELGINYDPSTLPSGVTERSLRLFQYVGGSWIQLPNGNVNTTSHIVYAPVTSTGVFAVAGTP